MANSGEERPYADYSEREIFDAINQAKRDQKYWARELKNAKDAHDWEESRQAADRGNHFFVVERQLRRELEIRREQRAARTASGSASNAGSAFGAIKEWLQVMGADPGTRIYHTWEYFGHRFYATYSRQRQSLSVWVQVLPGTQGASMIGTAYVMPANNQHELGQAFEAEKRAAGQH